MSGPTGNKFKGSLFVISLGTGSSPYTYLPFSSARSTDFTVGSTQVDVSAIDGAGWRQYLVGGGVSNVAISVQGVFTDNLQEQALTAAAFGNTQLPLEWTAGNGDKFVGMFAVSSYKRSGTYNGEEAYTATFDSAGAVTLTQHS